MLFNSSEFLLRFLPVTFAGYALLSALHRRRAAGVWLTLASLVFYSWWNPSYAPLLIGSVVANFLLGGALLRNPRRWLLILGVALNLGLLGYYKYTGFGVQALDQITGAGLTIPHIVLPLAISFFTFQQIAYLSDAHDQAVEEHDFLNYCLFITFFPHLIAGPITHHREMLGQFTKPGAFGLSLDSFALGITVFLLGLAKKVIIADPFGQLATPVFAAAGHGAVPSLIVSWTGALAYTVQIYFDFSGYTDMAIGLALLFNVQLPQNFNSPYKAHNVIEYWNRWHMSLTRFLTTYVYNPMVLGVTRRRMRLGLSLPRKGRMSPGSFVNLVAFPTIATLFLSGIWHGAGWQFLVFGLLHGSYLVVNHAWRTIKLHRRWQPGGAVRHAVAVGGTFLCVVVTMVFFRASSVAAAGDLLQGMAGLGGVVVPASWFGLPLLGHLAASLSVAVDQTGAVHTIALVAIAGALAIVWTLPNVGQLMLPRQVAIAVSVHASPLQKRFGWFWRPSVGAGALVGMVSFCALIRALSVAPSEFLYFKF